MPPLYTTHQRRLHEESQKIALSIAPFEHKLMPYFLEPESCSSLFDGPGPCIPSPSLFNFTDENTRRNAVDALPTIAECATHLALLHAINRLRREVLNSQALDKTLGIQAKPRTVTRKPYGEPQKEVVVRDTTFAERRKVKWSFYLKVAAARFVAWAKEMDAVLATVDSGSNSLELAPCPPLDVLLVWHSALLNPGWFRRFCGQHVLLHIRRVRFPWRKIYHSLNTENWKFTLSKDDSRHFQDLTGNDADLILFLEEPKTGPLAHLLRLYGQQETPDYWYARELLNQTDRDPMQTAEKHFLRSLHNTLDWSEDIAYLTAAVERQLAFVDKMVRYLWIRSPAIEGTLTRGIDRYKNFLQLFSRCPKTTLVPTLDIDLVWHTHQCSAEGYERETVESTGHFINHNDNISQSILRPQGDQTAIVYQQYFGAEYRICLCWECESIRSAVEGVEDMEAVDFGELSRKTAENVLLYRAMEARRRRESVEVE